MQKLEESKEGQESAKSAPKDIEMLQIYTKRIDKNSILAMKTALPFSRIHTLKFANNGFTVANLELLFDAVAASPVTRLFVDWNSMSIPKKVKVEGQPDIPRPCPYAKP